MRRTIVMAVLGAAMGAAEPASQQVDVAALVEKLGSADFVEREEAVGTLVTAYAEQAEEIEAASKRAELDPQAAVELQRIISEQKPRVTARARAARLGEEDIRRNHGSALESYEKVGKKNPAWDGAAREMIGAFTRVPGGAGEREKRLERMAELRESLKGAGCNDPLVMYYMARAEAMRPGADMAAAAVELKEAVDALEQSAYPANRKCWGHARYAELILRGNLWNTLRHWKNELGREVDLALERWPEVVKGRSMTDPMLLELAEVLEYNWIMVKGKEARSYGDRGEVCEQLFAAWSEARPRETGAWVYKGKSYVQYAWDARGSGWGNTVTDDGWRLMGERLKVARSALQKAYEMDPLDPRPATEMIGVELGEGDDRAGMELWWVRAMEANPDNYVACHKKLYYLEPKWHGSAGEMIAFGRECLASGNWEGRIPFVLLDAHLNLAAYATDKHGYLGQAEVWKDVQSVYEPYLARYPEAVWDRSHYAYRAARCGKWDVAARQFEILGDKPEIKPFGTREAYDYLRQKAKRLAGPAGS